MAYSNTQLFINGKWRPSQSGRTIAVLNPATEETIGTVAHADRADLDEALEAAAKGFKVWRAVAPFERCRIMRKAAAVMRERNDEIAPLMTMEQGKTLAEAKMEAMAAADVIEWFAEEAKRAYGRVIPARGPRHLPDRGQGAGRPGRGLHAMEFPDQSGRQKTLRGPCGRLLDHRQGARGNAGVACATDQGVRRCGRA